MTAIIPERLLQVTGSRHEQIVIAGRPRLGDMVHLCVSACVVSEAKICIDTSLSQAVSNSLYIGRAGHLDTCPTRHSLMAGSYQHLSRAAVCKQQIAKHECVHGELDPLALLIAVKS